MIRTIALIDGEHYLPVTKAALRFIEESRKYQIVGAVFLGGTEKIGSEKELEKLDVPIIVNKDMLRAISEAVNEFNPEVVFDLSDEPVLGYRQRFNIANLVLSLGVVYEGADFRFDPPQYAENSSRPSLSIIGLGKRVGKTACGGYVARLMSGREGKVQKTYEPCIVTMGRGGPAEPEVVRGDQIEMTPDYLLGLCADGRHAASDHFENALLSRVPTVGCRRCGGGFAGVVVHSNVREGAKVADSIPHDLTIFEGSGTSIPPVQTDAWIIVMGAHQPVDFITSYMGPYRIHKCDMVILTHAEEPMATSDQIDSLVAAVKQVDPSTRVVRTVFRPRPLADLSGKNILFTTTAPPSVGALLTDWLESQYSCSVVATSHHLSNRPKLRDDITDVLNSGKIDLLLTEIKAASIDVAARMAKDHGVEVAFADNIPTSVEGDDLDGNIMETVEAAVRRFNKRKPS